MPEENPIASGGRVAIIGAGPAGCIAAAAILDMATIRGLDLSLSLYGAGLGGDPDELLLADEPALARVAAAGLPATSLDGNRLHRLELFAGSSSTSFEASWFASPRRELVSALRALAAARGVRLIGRRVEAIARTLDGGWILRASGASERADRVILACGAGAPIAALVPGHRPPPIQRSCVATLDLDEALEQALAGKLLRVAPQEEHPALQIVAFGRRAWVHPEGPADPRGLALALLAASTRGALPGGFRLRGVRPVLIPDGLASPGCPTIGAALGGAPGLALLGTAAAQAQALAASILHPDPLETTLQDAAELEDTLSRRRRRRRGLERLGTAALERSLQRSDPGSPRLRDTLAATSSPAPDAGRQRGAAWSWVVAWWLLLCFALAAWLKRLWGRRSGARTRPRQGSPPSRLIYVVEDDPDSALLLGEALGQRRIPYRIFENGIEAAAHAPIDRPAAIVLDVVLPWVDGVSLAPTLKAQSDARILLTTSLPRWRLERLRPPGVDRCFTKPLDPSLLAGRLARYLPAATADPAPRRHSG